MINTRKYQTGGAAPQQEASSREQIQLVVMQISEMTGEQPETVMAAIKNGGENFKQVIQALQSGDAQTAKQMIQQLAGALMAKQGAKLQYIKNLKGTCPEGTHLEYYKAGGRLCKKCMKNQEEEVKQEKKGGVLSQYKEKVKKDCGGAKMKAGCGAKMKKHQIGGTIETLRESLGLEKKNLSKFQKGGGLPTAPKAEDRYRDGRRVWNTPQYKEVSSASNIFGDPFASRIAMEINNNNDTTFYETPGRWLPVNFRTRTASKKKQNFQTISWYPGLLTKESKTIIIDPEYETLKRRFNTAWNLAK